MLPTRACDVSFSKLTPHRQEDLRQDLGYYRGAALAHTAPQTGAARIFILPKTR